jgi:hypothetical protein
MMEAGCTYETSVCFNKTTRLYIQEGYHLNTRSRDNPKSHMYYTRLAVTDILLIYWRLVADLS